MLIEQIYHNQDKIRRTEQQPFAWRTDYRYIQDAVTINPALGVIINGIPNNINREEVTAFFERGEIYAGFIASLLWGHAFPINFKKAANVNREEVEQKVNRVIDILRSGDVPAAFESMLRGTENSIKGVGLSFLTKLMYFMSSNLELVYRPLIWDSVMQKVHCRLMTEMYQGQCRDIMSEMVSEDNYNLLTELSSIAPSCYYSNNRLKSSRNLSSAYMDYLKRMHIFGLPADKLEIYLFDNQRYNII